MDEDQNVFPKQADRERLALYGHFDKLYFGAWFDAFSIKGERDFTERYRKLRYIVANFAGLMSKTMADMLFGEGFSTDYQNNQNQLFADEMFEQNQFMTQLHESELGNSRRGDALFKLRVGKRHDNDAKDALIIEEVTPAIYFPVFSRTSGRNQPDEEVIAHTFKEGAKTYLHKETHTPGKILHEIWLYDESANKLGAKQNVTQFGYVEEEDTGVKRSLVFHIPNVRDGSGFFGTSDYKDLESLFFALSNRITKIDNILDKHSDPILAVPPGIIDAKGKVRKEALGMFEVDNETPGFNKPEYIVWNANLESAFAQLDKLLDMLFMFSEISPATMGLDKGGQAESGRALKFKLLATIRKRNRKMRYYDQAIKDILQTSAELALVKNVEIETKPKDDERPKLVWDDGIINDEVERTEIVGKRIEQGTMSEADGLVYLDGMTPDEAKDKAKEIEEGNRVSFVQNQLTGNPNEREDPRRQAGRADGAV